jgi:hypothetical protein
MTNLTSEQMATVDRLYSVYRNAGTVQTGRWVYQPHDYDSSFQLWSDGYDTQEEAYVAAYAEFASGALADDPEERANDSSDSD